VVSNRRYSGSSYVQVFKLDTSLEETPALNNLMDLRTRPRDGDGNKYIPR
jgi:hypothetical protein